MNPELPRIPPIGPQLDRASMGPQLERAPEIPLAPHAIPLPTPPGLGTPSDEMRERRLQQIEKMRRGDDELAPALEEIRAESQKAAENASERAEILLRMGEKSYWLKDQVRWNDRVWWITAAAALVLATVATALFLTAH